MTEQHECELEIVRRAVPYAVCTNPSCPLAIYEDEINKRLNEYEKLNTQRNELIAAVAGMRDKWTPPDEVAKLQTENEKLKRATEALKEAACNYLETYAETIVRDGDYDRIRYLRWYDHKRLKELAYADALAG